MSQTKSIQLPEDVHPQITANLKNKVTANYHSIDLK
jgi:hypothetical protein